MTNKLYYGGNFDVLRRYVCDETADINFGVHTSVLFFRKRNTLPRIAVKTLRNATNSTHRIPYRRHSPDWQYVYNAAGENIGVLLTPEPWAKTQHLFRIPAPMPAEWDGQFIGAVRTATSGEEIDSEIRK